tara:strand:- start:10512 stop:11789 length:1278 start_codon:yes stop_codon:yes gene_type:complete
MVNESFIKEAYTNLCKNKDTYFYNILKKNQAGPFFSDELTSYNESITPISSSIECKKKCIEKYKNDCAFYTINNTTNKCTMYKNDGKNFQDYKFLIDCGGKNYKKIPEQDVYNENIKLSSHDSAVFNKNNNKYDNSGLKGIGYVNPNLYRENPSIFRNVNYAEELTTEIIDLFDQIKEDIKDFANKIGEGGELEEYKIEYERIDKDYPDIMYGQYIVYKYTADVHTYTLLKEFYKKMKLLADYLIVPDDQLFYSLIPQSKFIFRVSLPSTSRLVTNSDGNFVDIVGNFDIDWENYHLTDDEYLEKSDKNYIITVKIGDKKIFENTEIEAKSQNIIAQKFIDLKKKTNKLNGEEENIEIQSKKQKQTLFVYALIFIIGIITITGFFNTKISIILFIISIFIILFINYYMDIKNLINFKDYVKHIKI